MNDCRVYWGTHGCDKRRGHRGSHYCHCCRLPLLAHAAEYLLSFTYRKGHRQLWSGCVGRWPYYGRITKFYGEDAPANRRLEP